MAENERDYDRPESVPQQSTGLPVVVGIGASAGGVQALQTFFEALAGDTGAAFVVVVHLDPRVESDLSNILAARTGMPVMQVGDPVQLAADHVYVIPPNRRLQMSDHEISALEFDEPRGKRAPIDLFFRSLAGEHSDGFAVILTGAGSDGAVGIRAVKETGGIILVQDPNEAEYPSMPRAAIATGIADLVLPIRELAGKLDELVRDKKRAAGSKAPPFEEETLRGILAHLRVRTGHDFSKYKRATVLRRIARRMQITRIEEPSEYYEYLRESPDEAQALLADLLISVTAFFRDHEAWDVLKQEVLPQIFRDKEAGESIRVWVPGCATGEEAYTISILLLEEAARHPNRPAVQVFGSDLDPRALAIAREGRYPAAIEADINAEHLRRYFVRQGDDYQVRQELRDLVLFANHSLLKDPPFSHVDLISCRNLLIYLDRDLQHQACSTFHYALNPEGFLFLGVSELADNPPGLFHSVDRKARIYQSSVRSGEKPRLLPRLLGSMSPSREQATYPGRPAAPSALISEAVRHRQAIEYLAPPSVLVDSTHRVIHLSDNSGRYLQPAGGAFTGDVVDLVRPELRLEMRSAINRAFEGHQPTLSLPQLVRFNGAQHRVYLQVKPVMDEQGERAQSAIVMFIEGEPVEPSADALHGESNVPDDAIRLLTEELQLTQARLRATREDSDAANEELRAANEELQSINEEYRSTSEELETSKEELQSINEELQTVNSELKLKFEAVSRAHNDLQNLMAATDFGTLFLDSSLRIKRFTQPVTELFSITPSDEGRPVTDFAHRLEYDDLVADAQSILVNLIPIQREVRSRDGRWYDLRMRPYRTLDNKIDGVVMTFMDVSERRRVEEKLRESEVLLRQEKYLVDLSHDAMFLWEFDGGILDWNQGSEELYGYTRQEALGRRREELLRSEAPDPFFAEVRRHLAQHGSWTGEIEQTTKDGRELTVESRIVLETINGRRLAFETIRDITERKMWEERQQLLLRELTHRVKNTLTVVQSIAHQTMRNAASSADFVERFDGRLSALASAHSLLVESRWHGADLGTLIRHQLEPYVGGNPGRLRLDGEAASLSADLATPFGLVLHELATNAVKYGCLSRSRGSIHINWTTNKGNAGDHVTVIWREKGGPPVRPPKHTGFGGVLIEKGVPRATVKREFKPDGLICTIDLPLVGEAQHGAAGEA